jgi:hypothetical protein
MKTKTKSILALTGVLILGIVIGALGSSLITRHLWNDRVSRFRTSEGFTQRILERIDPDPDKREAVKSILIEEHKKLTQKYEQSRIQIEAYTDSVLAALKPLLNEEQMGRATHFLKRTLHHIEGPSSRVRRQSKNK